MDYLLCYSLYIYNCSNVTTNNNLRGVDTRFEIEQSRKKRNNYIINVKHYINLPLKLVSFWTPSLSLMERSVSMEAV